MCDTITEFLYNDASKQKGGEEIKMFGIDLEGKKYQYDVLIDVSEEMMQWNRLIEKFLIALFDNAMLAFLFSYLRKLSKSKGDRNITLFSNRFR